jgi:hypothetical protein
MAAIEEDGEEKDTGDQGRSDGGCQTLKASYLTSDLHSYLQLVAAVNLAV